LPVSTSSMRAPVMTVLADAGVEFTAKAAAATHASNLVLPPEFTLNFMSSSLPNLAFKH
jgi:hypothetical protein